jgi:VanZ family protein
MRNRKRFIYLLIIFVLARGLYADSQDESRKILYTNLIGSAVITTWGFLNWDYGDRSMHASSEGWFGKDTKYGGVDKLGHFYTTFVLSHYFSTLYDGFGFERTKAIEQGAISSLIFNTVMEVGDSFSDYGFSYEDFLVNILGSYIGYYLLMHPDVDDILDIRVEYKPTYEIRHGDSYDILTDYNGMKFLTAIKFDGFESLKGTFLKYFEFHIGYYTRKEGGIVERDPYLAVGVNLSHILKPVNRKIGKFFNYYQLPYIYIPTR